MLSILVFCALSLTIAVVSPFPNGNLTRAGSSVYIVGGNAPFSSSRRVDVLNLDTLTWSRAADLPDARYALGAVTYKGQVYSIGGFSDSPIRPDSVLAYDQLNNRWKAAPDMRWTRHWLGVATIGNQIYAVGGSDQGASFLSSIESFDGKKWTIAGRGIFTHF